MEHRRVQKAFLISWSSKAAFMASWATFCYFVLVYGLKMYDNIGPGKERDFMNTWINYMLIDNLFLQWHSSLKNAMLRGGRSPRSPNLSPPNLLRRRTPFFR